MNIRAKFHMAGPCPDCGEIAGTGYSVVSCDDAREAHDSVGAYYVCHADAILLYVPLCAGCYTHVISYEIHAGNETMRLVWPPALLAEYQQRLAA